MTTRLGSNCWMVRLAAAPLLHRPVPSIPVKVQVPHVIWSVPSHTVMWWGIREAPMAGSWATARDRPTKARQRRRSRHFDRLSRAVLPRLSVIAVFIEASISLTLMHVERRKLLPVLLRKEGHDHPALEVPSLPRQDQSSAGTELCSSGREEQPFRITIDADLHPPNHYDDLA